MAKKKKTAKKAAKKTAKKTTKKARKKATKKLAKSLIGRDESPQVEAFQRVAKAFAKDEHVAVGSGKGFGSGTLQVNSKIFAMVSTSGEFVVKLPKARIETLTRTKKGRAFDLGNGRIMKEWLVVTGGEKTWLGYAKEAREFVAG